MLFGCLFCSKNLIIHSPPVLCHAQIIIDPRVLAAVDWKRLEYLATDENEARASALNPFRYEEFLDSYKTYVERWCPCGN